MGGGQIRPQEAKVKAIQEYSRPTTKKQIMRFLGATGYYRRFIKDYSTIAACLTDLTKKMEPDKIQWQEKHQQASVALKKAMSEAAVMSGPDANLPYTLSTDASGIGIGAVLEQELQGEVRPIAYYSRKLQPREIKYSATELEALAIHEAVKHFAIYLLGSTFTVVTDHKALIFMETMKHCSARVNRWVCELQFSTRYRKGSENH